jgi:hypothetical protein
MGGPTRTNPTVSGDSELLGCDRTVYRKRSFAVTFCCCEVFAGATCNPCRVRAFVTLSEVPGLLCLAVSGC